MHASSIIDVVMRIHSSFSTRSGCVAPLKTDSSPAIRPAGQLIERRSITPRASRLSRKERTPYPPHGYVATFGRPDVAARWPDAG